VPGSRRSPPARPATPGSCRRERVVDLSRRRPTAAGRPDTPNVGDVPLFPHHRRIRPVKAAVSSSRSVTAGRRGSSTNRAAIHARHGSKQLTALSAPTVLRRLSDTYGRRTSARSHGTHLHRPPARGPTPSPRWGILVIRPEEIPLIRPMELRPALGSWARPGAVVAPASRLEPLRASALAWRGIGELV
jgi:hypothetical protein